MTDEEEQRIRERAYTIWEREGRPHGRDLDHRMRAEAEIAAERSRPDDVTRDREPLTNARQAAEAIFKPNRQVNEQSRREGAMSDSARRPRVLPILPKPVDDEEFDRPRSPKPQMTPKIAGVQFARIRTLVRYGMTARQVAEVYGVAVDEIERILRIA
jgi:hypothetical protein